MTPRPAIKVSVISNMPISDCFMQFTGHNPNDLRLRVAIVWRRINTQSNPAQPSLSVGSLPDLFVMNYTTHQWVENISRVAFGLT